MLPRRRRLLPAPPRAQLPLAGAAATGPARPARRRRQAVPPVKPCLRRHLAGQLARQHMQNIEEKIIRFSGRGDQMMDDPFLAPWTSGFVFTSGNCVYRSI